MCSSVFSLIIAGLQRGRWRCNRWQIAIVFAARREQTENGKQPNRSERENSGEPKVPARNDRDGEQAISRRKRERDQDQIDAGKLPHGAAESSNEQKNHTLENPMDAAHKGVGLDAGDGRGKNLARHERIVRRARQKNLIFQLGESRGGRRAAVMLLSGEQELVQTHVISAASHAWIKEGRAVGSDRNSFAIR